MIVSRYKGRQSALTLRQSSPAAIQKRLAKSFEVGQSLPPLIDNMTEISSDSSYLNTQKTENDEKEEQNNLKDKYKDPISDPELSSLIPTISSHLSKVNISFSSSFSNNNNSDNTKDLNNIFNFDASIEELPKPSDPNFAHVLECKCSLCTLECDYSNPELDLELKERIKTSLQEIVSLFNSPLSKQLTPANNSALLKMICFNIFRELPTIELKMLPLDDAPVYADNSLYRLELNYIILQLLVSSYPSEDLFSTNFSSKLIYLLNSPNVKEHTFIIQVIMQYYFSFPSRRDAIVYGCINLIQKYKEKLCGPFCVWPSLTILFRIFRPLVPSIKEQWITYFKGNVILLVLSPHMSWFKDVLQQLFILLSHLDSKVLVYLITFLINHFPETAIAKQVAYLNLLISLCENLSVSDFWQIVRPFFNQFAKCSSSVNLKVVESALAIWSNQRILPLIVDKSKFIFPIIYPSIYETSRFHWNSTTQNIALSVLKKMHDIDPFVFDELNTKHVKMIPQKQKLGQQKSWVLIARVAAHSDRGVDLGIKLSEIQLIFNVEQPIVAMSATRGTNNNKRDKKLVTPTMKKNNVWR